MKLLNLFAAKGAENAVISGGRSKCPQNRPNTPQVLSDVYNSGTRAKRRPADGRVSGRSMVEMLGVLAIIGVLSVGAIAGYSKAMMKYKLNKQTEQFSTVLNNFLIYAHEFKYEKHTSMNNFLIKLNAIPKEMIQSDNIIDILKNSYGIGCNAGSGIYYCYFNINMDTTSHSVESCRNIITAAKENHADVWQFVMYKGPANITGRIYGDKYCGGSNKCIRNMQLADIESLCRDCTLDDALCALTIDIISE